MLLAYNSRAAFIDIVLAQPSLTLDTPFCCSRVHKEIVIFKRLFGNC